MSSPPAIPTARRRAAAATAAIRRGVGAPPVRRFRIGAEIPWDQQASGTLDVTEKLLAAFAAAGSPEGLLSSYTGQGLAADWPTEGDD